MARFYPKNPPSIAPFQRSPISTQSRHLKHRRYDLRNHPPHRLGRRQTGSSPQLPRDSRSQRRIPLPRGTPLQLALRPSCQGIRHQVHCLRRHRIRPSLRHRRLADEEEPVNVLRLQKKSIMGYRLEETCSLHSMLYH
ncbi:Protein of unknown function [Pyronema omphalodes CBS 100304]|uniref:Uncharacterized protein n=1 Tax=Pyronema omphalodes (strain CBS 100304) TaxID=1076935 RepID=U4LBX0_PYROM|nr:Protein of unknown function [Pyronema omphalodes CBS 100304]